VSPEQFIKKWTASTLTERSASQQHFLDLCQMLGEPTPADADPAGETFTFEKGGTTATGGHGWADVWKKGVFAWEYKGPGKDLNAAYVQLKKYADMLENPPLLITSDTKRIEIHTNFTNTVKTVQVLELLDLADSNKRELLRAAFTNPEKLRPGITRHQVTKDAAENFSQLAHHLQNKGYEPQRVAHFLNRIIFCMFAEDVGLLPNRIFTKLATAGVAHPESFDTNAKQLFSGMAKGGDVAFEVIDWFNGGLFDNDATLPLDKTELQLVLKCAELDWSSIEPSIFGTLFERGLDPDKRSQQGAHYTDPETIMKIVGPVVLDPWSRAWETEKAALAKQVDRAKKTVSEAAKQRYYAFLERLANFKVLDPACGSGNFLYLALHGLKDFEKRVIHDAEILGLPPQFPRVGPEAVLGIEVNPYAAELARVTIWIGEIQWMIENGFGASKHPILKPLDQIECRDAILNEDGTEPEWPKANVVVGNPPFLGDKRMLSELGEPYVERLRSLYEGRVPGGADLVTYWFDKSGRALTAGLLDVFGLVATKSIQQGANRSVIETILRGAEIFNAWSNIEWVNEGAAVRVSLLCFAPGRSTWPVELQGHSVDIIYADLRAGMDSTSSVDLTKARQLAENKGASFFGICLAGPFTVDGDVARKWLLSPKNPNGVPNAAVLRPIWNGRDLTGRPQDRWVVDFGPDRSERDASLFELPFEYVVRTVKPRRLVNREETRARNWWRHGRPRPELRYALEGRLRYIATSETSKHRFFVWMPASVAPEHKLVVIPRDDDTTFGILSSHIHTIWAIARGSRLGVGNDPVYTTSACFETFPFPQGLTPSTPAAGYAADPRAQKIASAAKSLNELRDNWLNPTELIERKPEVVPGYPDRILPKDAVAEIELRKRTLTNLYNTNSAWLQHAHRELDEAVAAAYGWPWPLSDEEILKRLFALNRERAAPLLSESVIRPTSRSRSAKAVRRQPR
jgi:methylase of polypeptide subunit release factors